MSVGRIKLGAVIAMASFASVAIGQQATQQLRERQLERSGVQTQTERADAQSPLNRAGAQERTAGYRAGGQAGQSQELDKYLATCLLIKNQAEVEMNQFGQQRAENPQVKQFAQQMVQDHQQLVQQLEKIAGQQAGGQANRQTVGATRQPDTQRTPANAQPGSPARDATSSEAAAGGGGEQVLQQLASIDREITQRCGELAKEKLQEKQGAQFDKAFVGCQIGEHVGMLAALQVIQQRASGELAQVAQQAEQKVQQHLEHAEQLMKQLDSQQTQAVQ